MAKKMLADFQACSPLFPNDKGRIFFARSDEPIQDAFKRLIDNNITAMPVLDRSVDEWKSWISMVDVLNHLFVSLTDAELKGGATEEIFKTLSGKEKLSSVESVVNLMPFVRVLSDTDLYETMRMMVEENAARVAVIDAKGELNNVISMSRCLQFLSVGLDSRAIRRKTLKDLKIGNNEVVTISAESYAIDAFKMMKEKNVPSVAVTEPHRPLRAVNVITTTDLKAIGNDMRLFHHLYLTVEQFLKLRPPELHSRNKPPVVSCTENDSVEFVVKEMVRYKLHRIYVLDGAGLDLVGSVSIRDVLRILLCE